MVIWGNRLEKYKFKNEPIRILEFFKGALNEGKN